MNGIINLQKLEFPLFSSLKWILSENDTERKVKIGVVTAVVGLKTAPVWVVIEEEVLIYSICWFAWYKYSHHGQFQTTGGLITCLQNLWITIGPKTSSSMLLNVEYIGEKLNNFPTLSKLSIKWCKLVVNSPHITLLASCWLPKVHQCLPVFISHSVTRDTLWCRSGP